jgi:hypothetical protein
VFSGSIFFASNKLQPSAVERLLPLYLVSRKGITFIESDNKRLMQACGGLINGDAGLFYLCTLLVHLFLLVNNSHFLRLSLCLGLQPVARRPPQHYAVTVLQPVPGAPF